MLKDGSIKQLNEKPMITFAGLVGITFGAIAIVAALRAFARNPFRLSHLEKVIKLPYGPPLVKVLAAQPVITSTSSSYASAAAIIAGLGASCMITLTKIFFPF